MTVERHSAAKAILEEEPLALAQQRLYFLQAAGPTLPTYNVPIAVRLRGGLDADALERSLEAVAVRHEAFRTGFTARDGVPSAFVDPEARVELARVDLSDRGDEADAAAAELARAFAAEPFALDRPPLVRALLVRVAPDDHRLLLCAHHLVIDGWSLQVVLDELGRSYAAEVEGAPVELPSAPIDYREVVADERRWLESPSFDEDLAYWRRMLGGDLPDSLLPADHARPATRTDRGARRPFLLSPALTALLDRRARELRTTRFTILLSALAALLYRYSRSGDVIVGTPVANRPDADAERVVGLFVNTLPLRLHVDEPDSFSSLVQRAREVVVGALDHQRVPFERLVQEFVPTRRPGRLPIFDVALVVSDVPAAPFELAPGLTAEIGDVDNGTAKFDLAFDVRPDGDALRGEVTFSLDVFEPETAARITTTFVTLLEDALERPDSPIRELDVLGDEGRELLRTWNAAGDGAPTPTLHELYEARVAAHPDARALTDGRGSLTYRELDERANRLAHALRELGAGPEEMVAVLLPRSFALVTALLAVVKSGAAYVPLVPDHPDERLAYILDDVGARVVVTDPHSCARVRASHVLVVGPDGCVSGDYPADDPPRTARPGNAAYVIYTSGSTGKPKGVVVEHRSLVNLLLDRSHLTLTPETVTLLTSTIGFDVSAVELWGPLVHGGTCRLAPDGIPSLTTLRAAIREGGVTTVSVPSSLLNSIVDTDVDVLRGADEVLFGAEPCSPPHIRAAAAALPETTLVNSYGPTEASVYCTSFHVPPGFAGDRVPIGRPIANATAHVLDDELSPMPIGGIGELFVGGTPVSRGYLGRPGLTAERFLPDPFAAVPGDRLYRTGDLARFGADGRLEFFGRVDRQLKLRGFRIEPGEIEAALVDQPEVADALVVLRTEGKPRDAGLVGYVVPAAGAIVDPGRLTDALRRRLPAYMVPAAIVEVAAFPRGVHKVDLAALPLPAWAEPAPEPEPPAPPARPAADARTPLERTIAAICADVLGLDEVGVHDDFFALGGQSMLVLEAVARIADETGVDVPITSFFEFPTVAGLATLVDELQST